MQQVQTFVHQHGRIPRLLRREHTAISPLERELGKWCDKQRQRWKGARDRPPLTAEQQAALAAVPGWFWDEDDRWGQQRQKLEAFVRQHGRMPRTKATRKEPLLQGEQQLGSWRRIQRQRQRGTGGRPPLAAKQLAALEATPLWCSEDGP